MEGAGGELDDEIRAQFPLSFGKKSGRPPPNSSSVHSSTRRAVGPVSVDRNPNPSSSGSKSRDVQEEEEEDAMIGPPPPPPQPEVSQDEDDQMMIGPPRAPPPSDQLGSDDEDEMDSDDEDGPEEFRRIPLSNEIVLRGHSKVLIKIPFFFMI